MLLGLGSGQMLSEGMELPVVLMRELKAKKVKEMDLMKTLIKTIQAECLVQTLLVVMMEVMVDQRT
jgi:MFS-type transporter involved in bile tolerance (Atg22 family)